MERLRCGVVVTGRFIAFVEALVAAEAANHPGAVLCVEYLRCREGARAGEAWLEWFWVRREGLSEAAIFRIGRAEVYLSPQTQQGLKWRYLDAEAGSPRVG